MRLIFAFFFLFLLPVCGEEYNARRDIPVTISIRSIKDLRVKEGQSIRIGQVLAPRPLEAETPRSYISERHKRAVEKQQRILANFREIVEEEDLPEVLIQHEEAKLRDLEFEAKEHQLLSKQPKAFKDNFYRSPINGTIRKVTPLSSSDGLLSVELIVEMD